MLDDAIADFRRDDFANCVRAFEPYEHLILGDDGSFESLCNKAAYVGYIYQLLECWVDSQSRPDGDPDLTPSDWLGIAESLRDDIRKNRNPTDGRWNLIYTEICHVCRVHTKLEEGRFVCPTCGGEEIFAKP